MILLDCSRFGLLTVERVDLTASEHVGEHKVFEDLYTLWGAGLVVVLERLEEVL